MTNNRPTKQNIANYTEQHKPHNKIGVISGAHNKILDPALHLTPHFLRLYTILIGLNHVWSMKGTISEEKIHVHQMAIKTNYVLMTGINLKSFFLLYFRQLTFYR